MGDGENSSHPPCAIATDGENDLIGEVLDEVAANDDAAFRKKHRERLRTFADRIERRPHGVDEAFTETVVPALVPLRCLGDSSSASASSSTAIIAVGGRDDRGSACAPPTTMMPSCRRRASDPRAFESPRPTPRVPSSARLSSSLATITYSEDPGVPELVLESSSRITDDAERVRPHST